MPFVRIYFGIVSIQCIWKRKLFDADKKYDLKLHKYYATGIALTSNYYVQTKMKLNLQTMHHIF